MDMLCMKIRQLLMEDICVRIKEFQLEDMNWS